MLDEAQARSAMGGLLFSADGQEVGRVGEIFMDDRTGRAQWATVAAAAGGTRMVFVPLSAAEMDGGRLTVPYGVALIESAPAAEAADGHLSERDALTLRNHYGLTASVGDEPGSSADGYMVRSEERLRVSTELVEAGRVRVRKHVVTEIQQVEVTVRREEVRLEHVPLRDTDLGTAGDLSTAGEEVEFVLYAERPVVTTEIIPVERVRVSKEMVAAVEAVEGEVRKEQLELDDPTAARREPQ